MPYTSKDYSKETAEIIDFIKRSLPDILTNDQQNLRIVSEGDLQSCTYYHLRNFFEESKFTRWHILNKLYMVDKKKAKQFPDIVIAYMAEKNPRSNYPAFLIELKETKNFETDTAKVEIERLGKMIEYYDSILGFILYVCLDMRGNRKVKHTDKIMEEMIPKRRKKYLNAKTINIKGEKTYPADIDGFDEKIEILRKYRAKKPE